MSKNIIETVVGFIVLSVAVGFIVIAYESGSINSGHVDGYKLVAQFGRVDGINIGSDVKLSGVKIGKVTALSIDKKSYNAIAEMMVEREYKLPVDTSAEIIGNGFLGDKYIAITPGADEEFLSEGGRIEFTQSSISLESLIGKFVFGSMDSKKHDDKDTSNTSNTSNASNAAIHS